MSSSGEGPSDLTDVEKAAIDAIFELRMTASHYDILGVSHDVDRKTIRDAYFGLSRRFHPDVFFKRELGEYKQRLDEVFRALTRAYEILSNPRQRAGYDLHLASLRPPSVPPRAAVVHEAPEVSRTTPEPERPAPSPPSTIPQAVQRPPSNPQPVTHPVQGVAPTPPPRMEAPRQQPLASAPPSPAAQTASRHAVSPPSAPPTTSPAYAASHSHSETASSGASTSDVVVPPRYRGQTSPQTVPPHGSSAPAPPVDPNLRQRAMETMARRFGSVAPRRTGSSEAVSGMGATSARPAVADISTLVEERRARAAQFIQIGEEAQKKGDLVAALEAFKSAGDLNKGDENIRAKIDAVSQLVNTQRVNEYIEQAREAMRGGRADNAARLWELAWQGRPSDPSLLINAADALARHTKDHQRAVHLAQRALMIDPRQIKAYLTLASVFIDAGKRDSAREAIKRATDIDPNNATLKELRDRLGGPTFAEQLGIRKT